MAIREHPRLGTILMCDYGDAFRAPEMVKRRPVVVISPKIAQRHHLCTVVALSTTPPQPVMPYHCEIELDPPLPLPFRSTGIWVKGDMVNAVGFHRLDLIRLGVRDGRREYLYEPLKAPIVRQIRGCVLNALALGNLTKYL